VQHSVTEAANRLEVVGVSKQFGNTLALDNVSFALRRGEVHALLGQNGAGKSTLVKIIAGVQQADVGQVFIDGEAVSLTSPKVAQRHGVAFVDQELSVVPCLSIADNMLLGAADAPLFNGRGGGRDSVQKELDGLGLDHLSPGTLVEDLGMGDRQLVEIARALARDAKILILDEPTATLSRTEAETVFAVVRRVVAARGTGVIFVSHRLGEVLEFCDRLTVFRDGRLVAVADTSSLDTAGIAEIILGHRPVSAARAETSDFTTAPLALSVSSLNVPGRVSDFAVDVPAGQVVALAGQVGSGAADVLRALAGLSPEATGKVEVGGHPLRLASPLRSLRAGAIYASGDRKGEGLFLDHSVDDNLVATRLPTLTRAKVLDQRHVASTAAALRERVGVSSDRGSADVRDLSGGNQQKVLIGRSLMLAGAKVLLLDEPTRGVDVGGRADIHRLVRQAAHDGNAVLFASTELEEVLELADVVVTIFAGRVVRIAPAAECDAQQILADTTEPKVEVAG